MEANDTSTSSSTDSTSKITTRRSRREPTKGAAAFQYCEGIAGQLLHSGYTSQNATHFLSGVENIRAAASESAAHARVVREKTARFEQLSGEVTQLLADLLTVAKLDRLDVRSMISRTSVAPSALRRGGRLNFLLSIELLATAMLERVTQSVSREIATHAADVTQKALTLLRDIRTVEGDWSVARRKFATAVRDTHWAKTALRAEIRLHDAHNGTRFFNTVFGQAPWVTRRVSVVAETPAALSGDKHTPR